MSTRIWLDVPYESRHEAKAAGARWDPQAKSWYAPRAGIAALAPWAPLPELLPGEDRSFGNGLFPDMVPSSCWFTNVRSHVATADWDRLRKMVYRRAGNRCEACGAGKNHDARRWLEAHERWRYVHQPRSGRYIQRLTRLVCLCTSCHQATHFGHAQLMGYEQDALAHLCHVNDWTPQQAWERVDAAFSVWDRRSARVWELDLSMLTDAGITVKPPPEATERVAAAAAGLHAQREIDQHEVGRRAVDQRAMDRGVAAPEERVQPGVTVRAVSFDEAATSDDPLARLLRGQPPYPPS